MAKRSAPPGLVLGTRLGSGDEIVLRGTSLHAHRFVLGVSGSGKSKFLVSLIVQLINLGYACLVVDPHADLVHDVLLALWSTGFYQDARSYQRVQFYRFVGEEGRYPPFNVLKQRGQTPRETASWVWNALTRVWSALGDGAAPMMQQVMLSGLVALIENQRPLTDLYPLLTDGTYRAHLLPQVRDEQVQQFFAWFEGVGKRAGLVAESALRRIFNLIFNEALSGSLGCLENRLDMRTAIDTGISMLFDLSLLGDEATRLSGSLLMGQAEAAGLSRASVPETARRPAFLLLDEWSMFAEQSQVALERMLALCGKYGLSVTLSCQALGQARSVQAALQNCTPIVLRTGGLDSDWAAARVGTYESQHVKYTASGHPTYVSRSEQQREWAERLERLPARHAVIRLGDESIPFYTLGLPPVRGGERIIETLRARYSELLLQPATTTDSTTRGGRKLDARSEPPRRQPPHEPPVRRIIPWPGQQRGDASR